MKRLLLQRQAGPLWLEIFLYCIFFGTNPLSAQEGEIPDFFTRPSSITGEEPYLFPLDSTYQDSIRRSKRKSMAIGISSGTKGFFGLDVAMRIIPNVNVRLGYNNLNYKAEDWQVNLSSLDFGENDFLVDAEVHQDNIELLVEYALLNDHLRVVGGIAYHLSNQLRGNGILAEPVNFQDVVASPDDVGYFEADLAFENAISPYIGLGVGRLIPHKFFTVNADFGAYYRGVPQVDLEATNLLSANVQNEEQLEENLAFAKWWPVVAIRLGFRIL